MPLPSRVTSSCRLSRSRSRSVLIRWLFVAITLCAGTGLPTASKAHAQTPVAFSSSEVFTGSAISSVLVDPSGAFLYSAFLNGELRRWEIAPDGTLHNQDLFTGFAGRAVIGLAIDPAHPNVLWVSHNAPVFPQPAPDWSGAISRLTLGDGAFTPEREDVVVGLPRSARDHLSNGLAFGPDGMLYLTQGSNSAMGAPDDYWKNRPEHLLNAAVLRIDPAYDGPLPIDVQTEDRSSPYDPFADGAPVTIFATGVRNAYDLVWHTSGNLYVPTNGSAGGGNTPASPEGETPHVPGLTGVPDQHDYLFAIEPGGYYGHPNPLRGEYVLNGGNPTAAVDPAEVAGAGPTGYPVGVAPDLDYGGFAWDFGLHRSPNGVIEYRGDAFAGALQGALLVCQYNSGDPILVLRPDTSGAIVSTEPLIGAAGLQQPLDLAENPRTGDIYVAELVVFGRGETTGRITLLRPN